VTELRTRTKYVYDAEGRRVHRTGVVTDTCDSSGKRDYAFDLAGNWVGEYNSNGTGCKSEIYAGSRHLATYAGGTPLFIHSDWLGTVRLRNSATYPTYNFESCTGLPFGDALSCTGGDQSTLHFTGKERDFESGLDNFGARFDSSSMGRFLSPGDPNVDQYPTDPQSWNLYNYVRNNPLNYTDPDGRACVSNDGGKTYHNDDSGGQSCKDAGEPDTVKVKPPPSADEVRIRTLAKEMNKRPVLKFVGAVAGTGALIGATGGTACYYLCSSASIATLGTAGGTLAPLVSNPKLQQIVDSLFQATDKLPGGTAGAVTYELKMGDLLSQAGHSEKAETTITALTNLLKGGNLSLNDQIVARQMIQQLSDALTTKPFGQNP
jgi:RHS repeat-associated protein